MNYTGNEPGTCRYKQQPTTARGDHHFLKEKGLMRVSLGSASGHSSPRDLLPPAFTFAGVIPCPKQNPVSPEAHSSVAGEGFPSPHPSPRAAPSDAGAQRSPPSAPTTQEKRRAKFCPSTGAAPRGRARNSDGSEPCSAPARARRCCPPDRDPTGVPQNCPLPPPDTPWGLRSSTTHPQTEPAAPGGNAPQP